MYERAQNYEEQVNLLGVLRQCRKKIVQDELATRSLLEPRHVVFEVYYVVDGADKLTFAGHRKEAPKQPGGVNYQDDYGADCYHDSPFDRNGLWGLH